jgi:hypothetical protein
MKTNLQNDKTLEALSVFRMQCNFYGSQYTAFNSLSKQFNDIILQLYPGCNKKPIKKDPNLYFSVARKSADIWL